PAVGNKTCGHVVGKGQGSVALDRDVVVVINPAKVRKLQVPGQGRSLAGNTLHHASVAAQRVDVEIEQIVEARAVVARSQPLASDGHTDAGGDTLTERPGSRLHPGSPSVLRMSRTAAVQLPEGLDSVQRHRHAAQGFVVFADSADFGQV